MSKASIKDIAQLLGVSKTTVSWVLSGQSKARKISDATRDRVLEVAKELHFEPNFFAKALYSGKSHTIGLLVPDVENPFFARMARVVESEAEKYQYNVMYCSSEEDSVKEDRLIRMLYSKKVDGLIIAPTHYAQEALDSLCQNCFPFVMVDRDMERIAAPFVGTDNLNGAQKLVEHMLARGCRKIGVICSVPDISSVQQRLKGYRTTLRNAGIEPEDKLIVDVGYFDPERIRQGVDLLISMGVDSIFFTASSIAIPGLKRLKDLNIKIPSQVSVVSFDDIDLMELHEPAITAMAQPVDIIARTAVEMLVKHIDAKDNELVPEKIFLPAMLHARDS